MLACIIIIIICAPACLVYVLIINIYKLQSMYNVIAHRCASSLQHFIISFRDRRAINYTSIIIIIITIRFDAILMATVQRLSVHF